MNPQIQKKYHCSSTHYCASGDPDNPHERKGEEDNLPLDDHEYIRCKENFTVFSNEDEEEKQGLKKIQWTSKMTGLLSR